VFVGRVVNVIVAFRLEEEVPGLTVVIETSQPINAAATGLVNISR